VTGPVSQRARHAAASLSGKLNRGAYDILHGFRDEESIVQAFAKFEREVLEGAADIADEENDNAINVNGLDGGSYGFTARLIAKRIRKIIP